jgi:predicted transcriptional regulator
MDAKGKPKRAAQTTVRLTQHADDLLTKLAEKHGVSKTAIIEMAIREKAEREKVK